MVTANMDAAAPERKQNGTGRTTASAAPKRRKATSTKVPESRKAVGRYIKKLILSDYSTIVEFAADNGITETSKLDRIITGRKKIDAEFAPNLSRSLRGNDDFWITLEHKILAEPDICVPNGSPPEKPNVRGEAFMAGTKNEFNSYSKLTAEQIFEIEISRNCIIVGEGANRAIIPKDASPDTVKAAMEMRQLAMLNSSAEAKNSLDPK